MWRLHGVQARHIRVFCLYNVHGGGRLTYLPAQRSQSGAEEDWSWKANQAGLTIDTEGHGQSGCTLTSHSH